MTICAGLVIYFEIGPEHVLALGAIAIALASAASARILYLNRKGPAQ